MKPMGPVDDKAKEGAQIAQAPQQNRQPHEIRIAEALPPELLKTNLFWENQESLTVADLQKYQVVRLDSGWGLKHTETGSTSYPIQSLDRIPIDEKTLENLQNNLIALGCPQLEVVDRRRQGAADSGII